jgi:hypothetical protein
MSDRIRCSCRRCVTRGLMGPAIIITVGVLFLLDQMRGGYLSFSNTWPVILLVVGAINLASSLSSAEGHISGSVPPAAPVAPPNQYPGQGQVR